MLTDLRAWAATASPRATILHWYMSSGAEVDFVIERPRRLLPIEVKAASRVTLSDARHLRTFMAEYPSDTPGALLLYTGDDIMWLDRQILAVPWYKVI